MITYGEMKAIAVCGLFQGTVGLLLWHLPGDADENHEKRREETPFRTRFHSDTGSISFTCLLSFLKFRSMDLITNNLITT
jgi:hypothetical protein